LGRHLQSYHTRSKNRTLQEVAMTKSIYTGRELITLAVAVDRYQGFKFIKSHHTTKENPSTNFNLMLQLARDPSKSLVKEPNQEDIKTADEIVDYFEGLIFKAMERDLTDYEKKITEIIHAEDINFSGRDDRLPVIASLPNVYRNNITHDKWADEERSLRKVSDYEGKYKTRCKFNGNVRMSRYMQKSHSLLVAMVTDNNNIVKFFYDLWRHQDGNIKEILAVGNHITVEGYVKSHAVSNHSKCKETFINRVNITQEDK
jgi:hypothetical protein